MIGLPGFKKRQQENGMADLSPPGGPSASSAPSLDMARLEELVERAERAAGQLRSLDESANRASQIAALDERLTGLERAMTAAEKLAAQVGSAESQIARLGEAREREATRIGAAAAEVERIGAACADLAARVEAAFELRDQLERASAMRPQLLALRNDADAMTAEMRTLTENIGRLRAVHEDAMRAYKHASARLDGIDQRHQTTAARMEALERRAVSAEQALDSLVRIAAGVPDVNHQLNVLKALADQVAQKTAALEQQREAVERATGHAAQVVALSAQIETALRRQEEHTRVASALEAKLTEVQSMHASVLTRSEIISTNQRAMEDAGRDAARALAELREQMHASTERFELEIRSVDAASERIAELRASVKECEARLAALDAASRAIADTEAQARALASQVTTVSEDVSRIAQQAERLRAVRDDVGELDRTLEEMTQRVQRVEQIRPTLDVIGRDLATLNGAHETIRDGLEQVRLAYAEMTRLRERQAETDGWLSDADVRMRALQTSVTELERLRPFIDTLRGDVNQLIASTDAVEARRGMVDELHRRLGELDATAAQLHERTEGVRARMDAAEARFIDLAGQAAEAQRVAATIATVSASVEEAERRMTAVAGSVDTLEVHAKGFDEMEDRLRLFGQEIEQRQKALDAAAEHLTRASALRREAADAAQHLDEVTRTIAAQLGTAETRTGSLEQALRDLEARGNALGDLDKRMGRFEALLGKWEVAQGEASQALEQIASRQSMIDAVSGQINHALEIAERTMEHVQSIVAARRDVEETRELLDGMRAQLADANTAMHDFAERKRQVDDLERRLARADALAMDVRSTVEVIAAQRSLVDQVLERSGTLTFQMKQAEALTEALRTECLLATRLREAVTGVRQNGGSDA